MADDDIFDNPLKFMKRDEIKKAKKAVTKKAAAMSNGQSSITSFFSAGNSPPTKQTIFNISKTSNNNSNNNKLRNNGSLRSPPSPPSSPPSLSSSPSDEWKSKPEPLGRRKIISNGKPPPTLSTRKPPTSTHYGSTTTTTTTSNNSVAPAKPPSSTSKRKAAATTKTTTTTATNKRKTPDTKSDSDSDSDYILPRGSKKLYNISLDDLLKEKIEKGSFQENIDTDKILFVDDPTNKTNKIKDDSQIDVNSLLGQNHDFDEHAINQLSNLYSTQDLFLENSYQNCIDTELSIPNVMDLKITKNDLLNYPILQIIGDSPDFALLNNLQCMVEISSIDNIPPVFIHYIFSNTCYEENDLLVSQSFELLKSISTKIFNSKYSSSDDIVSTFLTFNDYISVFKSYNIKIDFDAITDFSDTSKSFSSYPKTNESKNFPSINLYRVLELLKISIEKQSFNIYQIKELIKFIITLSLDSKFLPKIPMNQNNVSHDDKNEPNFLTSIETLTKDQVTSETKLINSIRLIKSIVTLLLNQFFDEKIQTKEWEIKYNNNVDNDKNDDVDHHFEFKLIDTMIQLFEEIISIVGDKFKFSLYVKIAKFLPTNTSYRIHERFSLFCIYKLLEHEKLLKKEKSKKDKKKKKSKKSKRLTTSTDIDDMDNNNIDNNIDNNNEDEKMKLDDDNSQENKEKEGNNKEEKDKEKLSDFDMVSVEISPQDIPVNEKTSTSLAKTSLNDIIDLLKSNDILSSLIKITGSYVTRIKYNDLNINLMVNLVQLVSIAIDNVTEIRKHSSGIASIIRNWNANVREPENIDFNKSRIKDTLVLIQSKISGLVIKPTDTIESYFDKVEKKQ
ncbi:hypothetical protein RB653_006720 [Dictyostelium firmibasis]|uniref:Uncharacterized protein n=1 Tax=Dictyostelium firmibasis TaxID=79012 RepID=A0AAN7YTZ8_9MYCE